MTVRDLMDICARHKNLDDEVRIEVPNTRRGGYDAIGIVSADNDPLSGLFLIEIEPVYYEEEE